MEGQKKSGSSSSSFTSELFGSNESQKSSSSSAGIFDSMFPQPRSGQQQDWGSRKGSASEMGQQEKGQPCHLSSSLYYGGQDVYSSSSSSTNSATYKKDKKDDDPNGNNSQGASRGNWWQGSLYY